MKPSSVNNYIVMRCNSRLMAVCKRCRRLDVQSFPTIRSRAEYFLFAGKNQPCHTHTTSIIGDYGIYVLPMDMHVACCSLQRLVARHHLIPVYINHFLFAFSRNTYMDIKYVQEARTKSGNVYKKKKNYLEYCRGVCVGTDARCEARN